MFGGQLILMGGVSLYKETRCVFWDVSQGELTVYNSMFSRQEKLVQLVEKFARKASLRESWLADMSQVLDELDKGQDVHAVDAALKRHEAISADVHVGVSEELCVMLHSC